MYIYTYVYIYILLNIPIFYILFNWDFLTYYTDE